MHDIMLLHFESFDISSEVCLCYKLGYVTLCRQPHVCVWISHQCTNARSPANRI
jgi:hypothetical protein